MPIQRTLEMLSPEDCTRVHEACLKILEETGILFHGENALEILKKNGARINGKIAHISRKMVEDALAKCPSTFNLVARNPERSVTVGEGLLIHPPGGEVYICDLDKGRRMGVLEDVANYQKLFQATDAVDIAGYEPIAPQDVHKRIRGISCAYEIIKNTDKPMLSPMEVENTQEMNELLTMMEMAFGSNDFFQKNYCTWCVICPISPLAYSPHACDAIIEYAKWNQPILFVPASMTGITGPPTLFSTIVLHNTEMLAGLVLAQLVNPGVPVMTSATATAGNLKLATWECASPETALLVVGNLQMSRSFYHLPSRCQCGISSSKQVDYQAGFETMQSMLLAGLAGAQVMSNSMGTMENILATSVEKFLIDAEVVERVKRILKGIDTSEDAMMIDIIQEVGHSADYLWHPATAAHCRDAFQPTYSNWDPYDNWKRDGAEEILIVANRKYKKILEEAPETMIDSALDKDLKDFIKRVSKESNII